jgi:signal transduction histidine kinase
MRDPKAGGEARGSRQPPAPPDALLVWVVDDDPMAMTSARLLLEQEGHRARGFTDPRTLLAALKEGERPHLILADLYMPEIGGLELLRRVRNLQEDLPVTIVTSSRDLEGSVSAINEGAYGYLLKPVVPEQLAWLIGRLQRERSLRERVEMEQRRLAHAQRLAKLGMLTSGIAHEINNPNCFVLGNIDMLEKLWSRLEPQLEGLPVSAEDTLALARREVPEILREMRSGATRIAHIVRSLSIYSREAADPDGRCDLRAAIEEAATVLRNKLGVLHFSVVDEAPDLRQAAVNAVDLEQMLVNLLSNAADATAGSPRPAVTVHVREAGGGGVRVDIVDNGHGIDPAQLYLLETPFFTTKQPGEGTGLGLYITRQLVIRAGGTLSFQNNPGGGATFTLTLPIAQDNLSESSS